MWLLVVFVLLGSAGFGGSGALAGASMTCGVSCPCEEAVHDVHTGEHEEHAEADRSDDARCQDECPDDCPKCGCCLGVAMAVISLPMTSSAASCPSARNFAAVDASASRACGGVFRPPRSLT